MLLSECWWPLCCSGMGAHLASSGREMVGTCLLSSTLAEGDCGKQFPSVRDTQGVVLGLMAILCFSESETFQFFPRVILGVTLSSHSLLRLKDYDIVKVFMSTHRLEETRGDKDDGGSVMLKYRPTVQWNCIFILRRPISQLTCVNNSVFTHVVKDFYNGK